MAKKYDLYRFIKLRHRVASADWDEAKGIWNLKIENLASGEIVSDWGHVMITAAGVLKCVQSGHC